MLSWMLKGAAPSQEARLLVAVILSRSLLPIFCLLQTQISCIIKKKRKVCFGVDKKKIVNE